MVDAPAVQVVDVPLRQSNRDAGGGEAPSLARSNFGPKIVACALSHRMNKCRSVASLKMRSRPRPKHRSTCWPVGSSSLNVD